MIIPPAITEMYLCDATGVRLVNLDTVRDYEYKKVANTPSPFTLTLPGDFDRDLIALDNFIEIYRGFDKSNLSLDYIGLLRGWKFGDKKSNPYTVLYGNSLIDLITRRVVLAYPSHASAGVSNYPEYAINKVINTECLGGGLIATDRDYTSIGGGVWMKDASGSSWGSIINKDFAYKNVLDVITQLAEASAENGNPIFFDITGAEFDNTGRLKLQIFTNRYAPGTNRGSTSLQPVYVGDQWGNLINAELDFDYTEEVNFVRVLGAGEDDLREYVDITNTERINASIWNRREATLDCRDVDPGDTAKLNDEGRTFLQTKRPKVTLTGEIVETNYFRYGKHWFYGDILPLTYQGYSADITVKDITIKREGEGLESITCKVEEVFIEGGISGGETG